ncbi:isopimaradiene synthase, chloroplastic-like [Aristolochia californica]|uniref:isopimaradiene synthase, chloroplastic-like n=1 Tax=Aristolochia californica TaxID=171875 RepID=UPI0035DF21E6
MKANKEIYEQVFDQMEMEMEMVVDDREILLVDEIRKGLELFLSAERLSTEELTEILTIVDLIERLEIHRHFDHQIESILASAYRFKKKKSYIKEDNSPLVDFEEELQVAVKERVELDVLETLKDPVEEFTYFLAESSDKVLAILDLYRCSQIAFPFEAKIMSEAKEFAQKQLHRLLLEQHHLLQVEFTLDYPRKNLLPRFQSRNIVRQLWPGEGIVKTCLQLAKLDIDMTQKLHYEEIKEVKRWWMKHGLENLEFARERISKCHLSISGFIHEPKYSKMRIAHTKLAVLATIIDDFVDQPSLSIDGLQRFSQATQRWDPSLLDGLPDPRRLFFCLETTIKEVAEESSKEQEYDPYPFFKALWQDHIAGAVQEASWRLKHQIVKFDDYIPVATKTVYVDVLVLAPAFLYGEPLTEADLHHVSENTQLLYHTRVIGRLFNDLATFKREETHGEMNSGVSCYMRENPNITLEETMTHLQNVIEAEVQELELELFQTRSTVPESFRRLVVSFARSMGFFYRKADSYSNSFDKKNDTLVDDYVYYPLISS